MSRKNPNFAPATPELSRRNFLHLLSVGGVAALATSAFGRPTATIAAPEAAFAPFELPPLPYAYNALEPHIDEMTMKIHHDKHHAAYVTNLNNALKDMPDLMNKSIEDLLKNLRDVPMASRAAIQNNGGGHYNHTMFWQIMGPGGGGEPKGKLLQAINDAFGNLDALKKQMNEAGTKQFGSGWSWLVMGADGKLAVVSTPNQNNPLSPGRNNAPSRFPVMGIDVWEHAYYLKYQNRRADYLTAWWNTVNWEAVAKRFDMAKA